LALEIFAVHEVMDLADEWNTVHGRVQNVTKSVAETTDIMERLQGQAENTGQSFESIGSLFVQLTSAGSELHYTTDQVLDLTNAISKMGTLGGGTAAGAKRGMIQIEEMFSLGKVQMQHLKALIIDIPGAVNILAEAFGGRKHFDELVNSGQMTSKMFGDAFLKMSDEINKRFLKMPLTFARAFQTVRNFFGKLIYDIGQASHIWTNLAALIIWGGHSIVDTIRSMSDAVGGFGNLLETIGIIFAAAMGPGTLQMIGRLLVAIRGITAAGIAAAAPWYLIFGAILAVGLAVQDVWTWVQGGSSITEELIGPWEQWRETVLGWRDAFMEVMAEAGAQLSAFKASIVEAFTGNDTEIAALREAFASLFAGADPLGELKRGFEDSLSDIEKLKTAFQTLFPDLDQSGSHWTLGEEVRKTIRDVAELLRSIREAGDFLNGINTAVQNFSISGFLGGLQDRLHGLVNSQNPTALVPAGAGAGAGGGSLSTVQNNTITNNITTPNGTPQEVGAAAARGTQNGIEAGSLGREISNARPRLENGGPR
jgi:tape measure domain-containing protein